MLSIKTTFGDPPPPVMSSLPSPIPVKSRVSATRVPRFRPSPGTPLEKCFGPWPPLCFVHVALRMGRVFTPWTTVRFLGVIAPQIFPPRIWLFTVLPCYGSFWPSSTNTSPIRTPSFCFGVASLRLTSRVFLFSNVGSDNERSFFPWSSPAPLPSVHCPFCAFCVPHPIPHDGSFVTKRGLCRHTSVCFFWLPVNFPFPCFLRPLLNPLPAVYGIVPNPQIVDPFDQPARNRLLPSHRCLPDHPMDILWPPPF